jgi:hypothetical protein
MKPVSVNLQRPNAVWGTLEKVLFGLEFAVSAFIVLAAMGLALRAIT